MAYDDENGYSEWPVRLRPLDMGLFYLFFLIFISYELQQRRVTTGYSDDDRYVGEIITVA